MEIISSNFVLSCLGRKSVELLLKELLINFCNFLYRNIPVLFFSSVSVNTGPARTL